MKKTLKDFYQAFFPAPGRAGKMIELVIVMFALFTVGAMAQGGGKFLPGTSRASKPDDAQSKIDPLDKVPKLLRVLRNEGFEFQQGQFRILDPVPMACSNVIPTTWYNNVQAYMTVALPGGVDAEPPWNWERTGRMLFPSYLFRQDEALLIVGSTPPPMAYYSWQTFLFGRYDLASNNYDPTTGGFFRPYALSFSYLGDTVNHLTIRTTGSTPFNRPMAFISTGNRQTQERLRAALLAAGYPDAVINTETLPSSLVRFGYENADQLLFLMRTSIAEGGEAAMNAYQHRMTDDPALAPMRVYRVRPTSEFASDPLPSPMLRTRGTGKTEMDLFPTMERLRQAILDRYGTELNGQELDTYWPEAFPEGYPAIQRGRVYLGPEPDGSLGYGRDANYMVSSWFDLPDDGFAIVYGVNHAATGKATYSSASVYLHQKLGLGVSSVDSADLAAFPNTASSFLPGEPGIDKFYVWKVARNCHGEQGCMEARIPPGNPVWTSACPVSVVPLNTPVRMGFRAYAEPATKIGPADSELIYDRVIVFRHR